MKVSAAQLTPIGCFTVLLVFSTVAFLEVGIWPSYGRPDPKETALGILSPLIIGAVLLGLLSTALLGGLRVIRRLQGEKIALQSDAFLAVGALLWLFDLTLLFTSKHSLVSWA